jgi:hypothetical protein
MPVGQLANPAALFQRANSLTLGGVRQLQRAVGNRAVGELLSRARPGQPGLSAQPARPGIEQPAWTESERSSPARESEPRRRTRALRSSAPSAPRTSRPVALHASRAAQRRGAVQHEGIVQRESTQHSVARILRAGITVSNGRGALLQLGHAMDVWVEIDAGEHPVTPPNARPNTVYGLELQYWEYVNVPVDNKGATGQKPWNDIHGMKPDASTFKNDAPGCDMTWKAAVDAAAAGTLTGKKRIGFRDVPGLYEKPGRKAERTLQFRIVFDDGANRQEIFATQLLRVQGGTLGYSAYRDSTGNEIEAHGFGGADYVADSPAEKRKLRGEARRLKPTGLPSYLSVIGAVPAEVRQEILPFAAEIFKDEAAPYLDFEMAQLLPKVEGSRQAEAADDWQDRFTGALMGDVAGGVAAGQFLIPQIPGTQRRQKSLPSGGLLVALVTGNDIKRMYYTDGSKTNISVKAIPELSEKDWTLDLRSFAEVPIELVQDRLNDVKRMSTTTAPTTRDVLVQDDNTHLRNFTRQGANHIVTVGERVGPKIKKGRNVAVFDPEVRDVTGEWLKASYDGTTGFVRASKLAGVKNEQDWATSVKGELPAVGGTEAMVPLFERLFARYGYSDAVYSRLVAAYPGLKREVTEAFGENRYKLTRATAAEGLDIALFELVAALDANDPDRFVEDMMKMLKKDPGRGDILESVYNQHIAPGRDVPPTLGELVHTHFMKVFRERGDSFAVYDQLLTDYPDFGYRRKPAYRLVFGEDRLKQMLREREADEAARDVPKPRSRDNRTRRKNFLTHAAFSLTDFEPSSSEDLGKFDARFDPSTGQLDIIVKVYYHFIESDERPTKKSGEPSGFGEEFRRKTWTDRAKAAWKQAYVAGATGPFNSSGLKITCTRPGWEGISATPSFLIEEVALGEEHFVVGAHKSVLTDDTGGKVLKSKGSSGAGSVPVEGAMYSGVSLKETDVYDKLQDPRLHTYLHAAERKWNIEPAYLLDRRRLDEALAQHGEIVLGMGAETGDSIRNLADALKRIELPSSLATLHPIVLTGVKDGSSPLVANAVDKLGRVLATLGVGNPIEKAPGAGPFRGVVVSSKPVDPAIQDTYVTRWSRFTAAHEFGHQIGLVDDYYGAGSGEVIKEMISAGWLPPNTRADHLKLYPPGHVEGEDQARTIALLRRAGLEVPDLALDTPRDQPKTTSLMSGGFDVRATHMISAWEALVKMTAAYVDEKYWRIG